MIVGSMDIDGEESKEDSPQKSVRFTEGESSPDTHLKARATVVGEQTTSGKKKRRHHVSGTSDSEM